MNHQLKKKKVKPLARQSSIVPPPKEDGEITFFACLGAFFADLRSVVRKMKNRRFISLLNKFNWAVRLHTHTRLREYPFWSKSWLSKCAPHTVYNIITVSTVQVEFIHLLWFMYGVYTANCR